MDFGIQAGATRYMGKLYKVQGNRGITPALARELIAAGAPDGAWIATQHGEIIARGSSIKSLAEGAGQIFKAPISEENLNENLQPERRPDR